MALTAHEFLETIKTPAKVIFETTGTHIPTLIYIDAQGEINQEVFLMEVSSRTAEGQRNKDMLESRMLDLARSGVKAMAIVTEAWVVVADKRDQMAVSSMYAHSGRLSEHPERIEALHITASTPTEEVTAWAPTDRNSPPPGKQLRVRGWQTAAVEPGQRKGRFLGIWQKANQHKQN